MRTPTNNEVYFGIGENIAYQLFAGESTVLLTAPKGNLENIDLRARPEQSQ